MRVYILYAVVAGLCIYAYRDWFKALCGLILLMAFVLHPDFPANIAGVQGLNPWNILLANVVLAWLLQRRREGLRWDLPQHITVLLLLYLAVVVIGFLRMFVDRSYLDDPTFTTAGLVSEYLINTVKWVVPGLLLFDGCRNRGRMAAGMACVLTVYFVLALQVIRWMPPSSAVSGELLTEQSRKLILNEVGYHPVNMSMMLSGASWAIFATLSLVKRGGAKVLIVVAALLVVYAQALTAGRMGYATWGIVGLVLCLFKWRKYLLLLPLVAFGVALAVPGVVDRMTAGFGETSVTGDAYTDDYVVTSGRTLVWPYVLDKIATSPVVGHGRLAMFRTGLSDYMYTQFGEAFPHPHNAYLECLLDNGAVGFLIIVPFYVLLVAYAVQLFRDRRNPWFSAIGGVALSLLLALLVASVGSQTFYPREGAVGMWAAIGLLLRMRLVRRGMHGHSAYRGLRPSLAVPTGAGPLHVEPGRTSPTHAVSPDGVPGRGTCPFYSLIYTFTRARSIAGLRRLA